MMDKKKNPTCVGCGMENRTMNTSAAGWVNLCVNPECEINGKVFPGGPAIDKIEVEISMDWETSDD